MAAEISTCPFCGGPPELEQSTFPLFVYFVRCSACAAEGPGGEGVEQAIAAWNRRFTPGEALVAHLREAGRKGGSVTSPAKAEAARANGRRPKKKREEPTVR